jgi:energy-coupling factor transporter ATP-binding protein EcfA2
MKVNVENFQSIRQASVLVEGLTVVTGQNNGGKSALLRAVRGVFENTPGTSFVRHGTKQSTVTLEFDEGKTVAWSKGTSIKPTYVLDGGDPIYPGRDVPDEVKQLGVRAITVGGQDIWPNVAQQFTGQVFLIDRPGSVMAEAIADVERVGHLNRALRRAQSDRRQALSERDAAVRDVARLEADVRRFEGLDVLDQKVQDAKAIEERTGRIQKALENLKVLRVRLTAAQEAVQALQGVQGIVLPCPPDDLETLLADATALHMLRDHVSKSRQAVLHYRGLDHVQVPRDAGLSEMVEDLLEIQQIRSRWRQSRSAVQRYHPLEDVSLPDVSGLADLLERYQEVASLKVRWEAAVRLSTRHAHFGDVILPTLDTSSSDAEALEDLAQVRDRWRRACGECETLEASLEQASVEVSEAQNEFQSALAQLGQCPLCNTILREPS